MVITAKPSTRGWYTVRVSWTPGVYGVRAANAIEAIQTIMKEWL